MPRLPTLFVTHGAPTIVVDDTPAARFLRGLADLVPRPSAILLVTAHWTTAHPTVSADPEPDTAYDFGGFPRELYEMTYPAPGAPDLAARVAELSAKVAVRERRAFDHGTWTPLMLAWPKADIPVAELSVCPRDSARMHFELGEALAPLRDEGVLIMASGAVTHNLEVMFAPTEGEPPHWMTSYVDWLHGALTEGRIEELLEWERRGPDASINHPTPEHLLPLFVALGAAPDRAERLHHSFELGAAAMDAYRFE